MEITAVQTSKLKAERSVAEQNTASSLKAVGEAKSREDKVSKRYSAAVDKIISQLKGSGNLQNRFTIPVASLRQTRQALTNAKATTAEAKQAAQKQQLLLRKLSEKLEGLEAVVTAKKKCEARRKDSLFDDETAEISSACLAARTTANTPATFNELLSKVKIGLAVQEVSAQPVPKGSPVENESKTTTVTAIDPAPLLMPIQEVQVAKRAPGEVAVGFKNAKGEQFTVAVSQSPNGSVSLSWQGYSAHSKEVSAIEGVVLSKLRQSGIRSEGRRRRGQ